MMRTTFATSRSVALLATVLAIAGCENPTTKEKLAQLTTVSAEKDSLLAMMSENTKLLSDISSELAKVKEVKKPIGAVKASESPLAASLSFRDSLRIRISDVVVRLNQAESRLAASQSRVRNMGTLSDSMKAQLAVAERSITELRGALESQRQVIASLETEVSDLKGQNANLTGQNAQLSVKNAALVDTLTNAITSSNTVYYVIGTKNELKQKGIILEEGSKFLFFGSKVIVPAWNLNPGAFTKTDRRELGQIPLPKSDTWYKVVTRQNLQYLSTPATKDGKIKGESLHITEPDRFWASSPFLIIVEG